MLPAVRSLTRPFLVFGLTVSAIAAWSASAEAEAPAWTVDMEQSGIVFVATQLGAPFEGAFQSFEADIRFDADDLATSKAVVTIDTTSFDSGEQQRDDTAKGGQFFDVGTHPTAVFETTEMRLTDNGSYEADATLTMKAIAKAVTLPFTLEIDGETARMEGSLTIDRTEWTVGTGEWLSGDTVGKEVEIRLTVTATRVADALVPTPKVATKPTAD